ncbi:SDR family oxidoreductase [bacterium]|nr:SDR family oxidoreductase [bacterium]
MTTEMKDRTAVVLTGAAGGIGMATSRLLVERGFRVVGTLLDSEDAAPLEALGAQAVRLDVTQPASLREAIARIEALLGDTPLAGLINNAGIADGGPIELLDLDAMRHVFEVNVFGLVAVTQAFLPRLRRSRGRIINISSVSGRVAAPFLASYSASKFAVEAISDCLRRELQPSGIEVVIIEPAVIRTPIWDKALAHDLERYRGTPYEPVIEKALRRIRKGRDRGMEPIEVARVIADALTVIPPPTRIPVLRNRRSFVLAQWMPDWFIDRRIARKVWDATR